MFEIATIEQLDQLRKDALGNLFLFAKGILGFDWLVPHIHGPICRLLENLENDRLKICIPRGWLKTTLCSISYPLWRACRNNNICCLLVQNTVTNAVSKNLVIKTIVEGGTDNLFRAVFPEIEPGNPWKGESLAIKRRGVFPQGEGTFDAAGIRTAVISRHYDIIIEDDTVAPDLDELGAEALIPSRADIESAIGYHRLVTPLLNNVSDQILVVGTRWYESDLLSWIDEHESYYTNYFRSCREIKDPTTGELMPAEGGSISYPERFGEDALAKLKISVGPYCFACLYLGLPLRSSEMLFMEHWVKYYETEPRDLHTWTTVDPGGDPAETKGEPDSCAIVTTGKDIHTGKIFVLDRWRKKANPGEMIDELFNHVRKWSPRKVCFENVALQKNMLYFIKKRMREEAFYFTLEGVSHSNKEKNARIQALQPIFASGTIFLRSHMMDIVSELLAFPLGKNDDLIDALAMHIPLWPQTITTAEVETMTGPDPLSFDSALKEIEKRFELPVGSIYDVYEPAYDPMVF